MKHLFLVTIALVLFSCHNESESWLFRYEAKTIIASNKALIQALFQYGSLVEPRDSAERISHCVINVDTLVKHYYYILKFIVDSDQPATQLNQSVKGLHAYSIDTIISVCIDDYHNSYLSELDTIHQDVTKFHEQLLGVDDTKTLKNKLMSESIALYNRLFILCLEYKLKVEIVEGYCTVEILDNDSIIETMKSVDIYAIKARVSDFESMQILVNDIMLDSINGPVDYDSTLDYAQGYGKYFYDSQMSGDTIQVKVISRNLLNGTMHVAKKWHVLK